MGAFVIIGILNPLSDGLSLTEAQAGWILTTFAIAYAIGSPLLVALTGQWDRRRVLLTGLLVFTLATAWSALSGQISGLLASRVAVALGAAMITPVTAGIIVAVSPPEKIGKSLAGVFFGLTLAQAIGIPVASYIGYTYGWSAAFWSVVVLGVLSIVGVVRVVPAALPFKPNSVRTLVNSLLDWRRFSTILFVASFLGSIYVLYTYFTPLLAQSMGYGRDGISLLLFVFGVGAVFGNMLGGWMADKFGSMKALIMICISQVVLLPLYSMLPMPGAALMVLTFVWSVVGWAVAAPQQMRIVKYSPGSENVALALHASSIYIGISVGALVGGFVVTQWSLNALGIAATVCMFVSFAHLLLSERAVNSGKRAI